MLRDFFIPVNAMVLIYCIKWIYYIYEMKKHIIFCFVLFSLTTRTQAQQGLGQIVINAGVGYSPEFDGDISFGTSIWFPVRAFDNSTNYYPPWYSPSNVTPNIGATADFGMLNWFSIGLAGSYQSESINWTPTTINSYAQPPYPYNDKVTRINVASRLLFHLNKNRTYFEHYLGFRIGGSFWHDVVYPGSYINPMNIGYLPPPAYFISKANLVVPSFQLLYGMRFYITNNFGINFEFGIGSPYLAEAGLTFRINTKKASTENKPTEPVNEKKN